MDPVDVVRDVFARFNAGERDGLSALAHPEFEVDSVLASVEGARYRGRDGLRDYLAALDEAWGRFQLRGDRFEPTPAGVLVVGAVDLRASASGVVMDVPVAWLWRFEDGLVRRLSVFTDPDEAVRAARA